MSQGTYDFAAGEVFELERLNRTLAHLSRPASSQEWLTPLSKDQLIDLGLAACGPAPQRRELIERLWTRKRHLLRTAGRFGWWGPDQPVA